MPLGIFGKLSGPPGLARRRALGLSFVEATGGNSLDYIIDNNEYFKRHTFTSDGTLNVTAGGNVDFVLIGGGSMGGRTTYGTYARNGGSGGGVVEETDYNLSANSYSVVIGAGGSGSVSNKDGEDSTFDGNTAGGGVGSVENESGYTDYRGNAGSPQNSFVGGNGRQWGSANYNYGGGGAGAGGNGGSWTDHRGGDGGDGYLSTITGERYGAGAQGDLDQSSNSDPSDGAGWGNYGSGGRWNSSGYDGAMILQYQVATPSTGRAAGNTSSDDSNSTNTNSTMTGVFSNATKFNRPSGNYNTNKATINLGTNWVNNSQFNAESNAFTIEFRVRWDNDNTRGIRLMTTNGSMGWNNSISNNTIQLSAEDGNLEMYVDGSQGGSWGNQSASDNTWYAIAICSDGDGTVRGYLDGSLKKTWTNINMSNNAGSSLTFGCGFITDSLVSGNYAAFDEMRFSNIARYTGSTYTVATSAFTNDSNTIGLYHLEDFNFTDDTGE